MCIRDRLPEIKPDSSGIIILKLLAPCGKCKGKISSDELYFTLKLNIILKFPGGISEVIAKPFASSIKLPSGRSVSTYKSVKPSGRLNLRKFIPVEATSVKLGAKVFSVGFSILTAVIAEII